MSFDFAGKNVFLTGSSRGIGYKIKSDLLKCGANVTAPGRNELDLSSKESVLGYECSEAKPDIFIHCAGVNLLAGLDEIDSPILEEVFQVNCFSPILLLKRFAEGMKAQKYGKIVFISSVYATVSRERRIAYSASKHACTGLVKTLALELAPYNIMVNAVAPGYVMTDMTRKNLSPEELVEIEGKIPTGRFQTEEDISNAVLFLCSELNNSITGQTLTVDGGFLCR